MAAKPKLSIRSFTARLREASHNLAGADTAEVGKDEPGTGLDEGVGRVDKDATAPTGQPLQGRLDVPPRHREQYIVEAGRFLDGRRRGASAEFTHLVGKRAGTAAAAQDNLMPLRKRLARNRQRDLTCSDRPDPHRPVLSILSDA